MRTSRFFLSPPNNEVKKFIDLGAKVDRWCGDLRCWLDCARSLAVCLMGAVLDNDLDASIANAWK